MAEVCRRRRDSQALRDTIEVGKLPAGEVSIAMEIRTPMGRATPAAVEFWINGESAAVGTVRRTVAGFTASETFDVGMDTSSPVADACFDKAPFAFEGELRKLYFRNLGAEMARAD